MTGVNEQLTEKEKARLTAWAKWSVKMSLLRQIHAETADKREKIASWDDITPSQEMAQ